MHNDDSPKADAHELLLLREQGLLSRRVELGGRVVVETKLNSKADKTTDETPQGYSLTLRERIRMVALHVHGGSTHLGVQVPVKKDQSLQA